MSQDNVDLVLALYPGPDVDYVRLLGEDRPWARFAEVTAPLFHRDFECVWHQLGSQKRYSGVDGLRDFMLDWTAPWVGYRVETEEAIDLGEQVLLLNHDRGCREGSTLEVRGRVAAVFTVRDGQIIRLDAYLTHADAVKAVGLEE